MNASTNNKAWQFAWTPIILDRGFSLGIATKNEFGYHPLKDSTGLTFDTWDEADKIANELNNRLGLSLEEAANIVISTQTSKERES